MSNKSCERYPDKHHLLNILQEEIIFKGEGNLRVSSYSKNKESVGRIQNEADLNPAHPLKNIPPVPQQSLHLDVSSTNDSGS